MIDRFWNEYKKNNPSAPSTYDDVYTFGGDSDMLVKLVLSGKKTATCSLKLAYDKSEELPVEGSYDIITYSDGTPACIVRTTRVYTTKFSDVTSSHARKEGEGDCSLEYWREAHREFFNTELQPSGLKLDEEMEVICEEFEVLFVAP